MITQPVLNAAAGAFCYRASSDMFLLGCASSNGGNAIDWARKTFGNVELVQSLGRVPIFLPWLNGERSFEWNPNLRAVWADVGSEHRPEDLWRAVVEGVVFNVAQYWEVVQKISGVAANEIVLSGNAFLEPQLASLLARLVRPRVLQPPSVGQASLRGAAVCAWRALGHDARVAIEKLLDESESVGPAANDQIVERYERFKQLRFLTARR
jgi:sugar (pentulose or hexulose) kinase